MSELALRRLRRVEQALAADAEAVGEPDARRTAASALALASHAALAPAVDATLVHLMRINFFYDHEPLPAWVEPRLLLSGLFDDQGDGLYTMDPALREVLLSRLAAQYGARRQQDLAMLLWQYTQRQRDWADRRELRLAQQLSALNFLAPERATGWLAAAESGAGSESLAKGWFVAMRRNLSR